MASQDSARLCEPRRKTAHPLHQTTTAMASRTDQNWPRGHSSVHFARSSSARVPSTTAGGEGA
eukprot:11188787-Lingulodinium_polyedra.AAC.1